MFKNKIEKYKLESRVLSYIDESGFEFDMLRRYGYSKVGDRCYGAYNWNAKGRENVIGALVNNSLTACGTVNGNVDSDTLNILARENINSRIAQKLSSNNGQCIFL